MRFQVSGFRGLGFRGLRFERDMPFLGCGRLTVLGNWWFVVVAGGGLSRVGGLSVRVESLRCNGCNE